MRNNSHQSHCLRAEPRFLLFLGSHDDAGRQHEDEKKTAALASNASIKPEVNKCLHPPPYPPPPFTCTTRTQHLDEPRLTHPKREKQQTTATRLEGMRCCPNTKVLSFAHPTSLPSRRCKRLPTQRTRTHAYTHTRNPVLCLFGPLCQGWPGE